MIRTLLTLFTALFTMAAVADDVRLEWDPNPEPGMRYVLHWGPASRNYTNSVTVSNTTATISNIVIGARYFVALTAIDTNGLQSAFSDEVAFIKPSAPRRLRLTVNLQSAGRVGDPWEDGPQFVTFDLPADEQRFYRAAIDAQLE